MCEVSDWQVRVDGSISQSVFLGSNGSLVFGLGILTHFGLVGRVRVNKFPIILGFQLKPDPIAIPSQFTYMSKIIGGSYDYLQLLPRVWYMGMG